MKPIENTLTGLWKAEPLSDDFLRIHFPLQRPAGRLKRRLRSPWVSELMVAIIVATVPVAGVWIPHYPELLMLAGAASMLVWIMGKLMGYRIPTEIMFDSVRRKIDVSWEDGRSPARWTIPYADVEHIALHVADHGRFGREKYLQIHARGGKVQFPARDDQEHAVLLSSMRDLLHKASRNQSYHS